MTDVESFNRIATQEMSKGVLDIYSELSSNAKENFGALLEASEIFDLLPVGVYVETLEGTFLYVNEYFAKNFGTTAADICLRKNAYDLTHPDDHDGVREWLENELAGKDQGWVEFTALCKDERRLFGKSRTFERTVRCKTRATVLTADRIEELLTASLDVDIPTLSKMKMFALNNKPLVAGIVLFAPSCC
tara:strand:+ start:796 stop:1365 length:570 start_codon:yes stop_codon:yes gene_type:complete